MNRIFVLVVLTTAFAVQVNGQTQNGLNWSRYFFSGTMAVGKNLASTVNPKSYAKAGSLLEVGPDTTSAGMLIPGVISTAHVSNPYPRMIVYSYTQGYMGYSPAGWVTLSGGLGGVFIEQDSFFHASPAATISDSLISAWNNTIARIDTFAEQDPVFQSAKRTSLAAPADTTIPTTKAVADAIAAIPAPPVASVDGQAGAVSLTNNYIRNNVGAPQTASLNVSGNGTFGNILHSLHANITDYLTVGYPGFPGGFGPGSRLNVNGGGQFTGGVTSPAFYLAPGPGNVRMLNISGLMVLADTVRFGDYGGNVFNRLVIHPSGNVAINGNGGGAQVYPDPGYRLLVQGSAAIGGALLLGTYPTDPPLPGTVGPNGHMYFNTVEQKAKLIAGGSYQNIATEQWVKSNIGAAHTLIVDQDNPTATDTRTGIPKNSVAVPFKTISGAYAAAEYGDVVIIQKGIYNESPIMDPNGWNAQYPGGYTTVLNGATVTGWFRAINSSGWDFGVFVGLNGAEIKGIWPTYPCTLRQCTGLKITEGILNISTPEDAVTDCDITFTTPGNVRTYTRCKITYASQWNGYSIYGKMVFKDCNVTFQSYGFGGPGGVPNAANVDIIFERSVVKFNYSGFSSTRFHDFRIIFRNSTVTFSDYIFYSEKMNTREKVILQNSIVIATNPGTATIVGNPDPGYTDVEIINSARNCPVGLTPGAAVNDGYSATISDY